MNEPYYFGQGAKFPLQVNMTTGRFTTNTESERVKESIYLILMTNKGERVMRPNYGTRLTTYPFENMASGLNTIFSDESKRDIMANEPRVSDVMVSLDAKTKPGCLFITIDYTLNATGNRENMVFPFYLDTTSDEE